MIVDLGDKDWYSCVALCIMSIDVIFDMMYYTEDPKKNPLEPETKIQFMQQMFKEHSEAISKLHTDINKRVGVLEKWRWIIIGGSIIVGLMMSNPDNMIFDFFS